MNAQFQHSADLSDVKGTGNLAGKKDAGDVAPLETLNVGKSQVVYPMKGRLHYLPDLAQFAASPCPSFFSSFSAFACVV